MRMLTTVSLLIGSNLFMTYAWYGHLKDLKGKPLLIAIVASWGVAFFEYCLQVPANRIGFQQFSLAQLKVLQEIITMCVFAVFAVVYMRSDCAWTSSMRDCALLPQPTSCFAVDRLRDR